MGGIWMLQKKDQACPMNMQNLYRGGIKWVSCSEIEFSRFRLSERKLQMRLSTKFINCALFFFSNLHTQWPTHSDREEFGNLQS